AALPGVSAPDEREGGERDRLCPPELPLWTRGGRPPRSAGAGGELDPERGQPTAPRHHPPDRGGGGGGGERAPATAWGPQPPTLRDPGSAPRRPRCLCRLSLEPLLGPVAGGRRGSLRARSGWVH